MNRGVGSSSAGYRAASGGASVSSTDPSESHSQAPPYSSQPNLSPRESSRQAETTSGTLAPRTDSSNLHALTQSWRNSGNASGIGAAASQGAASSTGGTPSIRSWIKTSEPPASSAGASAPGSSSQGRWRASLASHSSGVQPESEQRAGAPSSTRSSDRRQSTARWFVDKLSSIGRTASASRTQSRFNAAPSASGGSTAQGPSVNPRTLPGPTSNSVLSEAERSLVGAARWPDDAPGVNMSNKSHTPESKAYSESMWKSSRQAGKSIASGRIASFDALWSTATKWRLSTIPSSNPRRGDFASSRKDGTLFVTSLRPPYHSVRDRVQQHPDATTEIYSDDYLRDIETKVYRQSGTLSGRSIPMTIVRSATDTRSLDDQSWRLYRSSRKQEARTSMERSHPNMITHTDASYLPEISEKLESLYARATDPSLNASAVLDLVSRVHWWSASAAPDKRGSAAKSEFTARAIASAHSIELPPFKHGSVPDIEAMLSSEDEFASRYSSLFERAPL